MPNGQQFLLVVEHIKIILEVSMADLASKNIMGTGR